LSLFIGAVNKKIWLNPILNVAKNGFELLKEMAVDPLF